MLLSIFLISAISCHTRKDQEKKESFKLTVENCLGKELIIPDSLITYSPYSNYIADSVEISQCDLKIYSHINASCPTCIQDIIIWNGIIADFNKNNVPVILICDSKDKFELIKYLHETGKVKSFSYPLFFDIKKEYLKKNMFMKESQHFETVLTDKENNILLLGNPIRSKEIKSLYLTEIRKRMEQE